MQGNHRVATRRIGEAVGVVTTGGDTGVLVPVEAVAGHRVGVTSTAVVDDKVEGNHRVAARSIGEGVRQVVAAGGDTSVLVPVEAVAGHRIGVTGCRGVADGELSENDSHMIVGGVFLACKAVCENIRNGVNIVEAWEAGICSRFSCEPSVTGYGDNGVPNRGSGTCLAAITTLECHISGCDMYVVLALLHLVIGIESLYHHMLGAIGHMGHIG